MEGSQPESSQVNRALGWHGDSLLERGFSFSLPVSDWLAGQNERATAGKVTHHGKDDRGVLAAGYRPPNHIACIFCSSQEFFQWKVSYVGKLD